MTDIAWSWRNLAQLGGLFAAALIGMTSLLSCAEDGPAACRAAGEECKIGGFNCAARSSHDCNPDRNPGGAVCCLRDGPGVGSSSAPVAAESGSAGKGSSPTECRGPGYYETGKGNTYVECCAGLHEVFVGKTGYRRDSNSSYEPGCEPPPLRVSACVSGTCGDGTCEPEGEGQLCGCVEDCPSAVFTWSDAMKTGQLAAVPASCSKRDLVTGLVGATVAPTDCGDLEVGATRTQQLQAAACARDAFAAGTAFQLFWRTVGIDSVIHQGIVGRPDGGTLRMYRVMVDADVFGIHFPGAVGAWSPCTAEFSTTCDGDIASCLSCEPGPGKITCGCLPKGERPDQNFGTTVEFRCEQR